MKTMSHSCSHDREDLILFYYDELPASARKDLEARLTICPSCREQLALLESLEAFVPRSPSIELTDDTLSAIREATSRRIAEAAPNEVGSSSWSGLSLLPRYAIAATVLLAVFFLGHLSGSSTSSDPALAVFGESADKQISDIRFDPESGVVQIQYQEARPTSIEADISDERIQVLLRQALRDQDDPGSRLRAVKAVSKANFTNVAPDPALVDAMKEVLLVETNEGIRLQTLKALYSLHAGMPVGDDLKSILIELLTEEQSSAIRMEALQLLTRSELASLEFQSALQSARQDLNPFIRRQAEAALYELETKTRLEDVQ